MVKFSKKIAPDDRLKIAQLVDWLDEYVASGHLADEFAPEPSRRGEGLPTVRSGEVLGDVEVLRVISTGNEALKVRCAINLQLELDINDQFGNTDGTEGWMDVELEVDWQGRRVAGHRTHELFEDCFFLAP